MPALKSSYRRRAALAVPGDLATLTGGYLYDRRLLAGLRELRIDVQHIALPGSFPNPTEEDRALVARQLAAVAPDCPVIVDGLAFGAMDHRTLAGLQTPIVALVHHPLAEESGLDTQTREALLGSERDNLALASHVVVTSPHTARLLASRYGVASDRITIARPGIDLPAAVARPVDPPLILSVGIAVPRKGHDILLEALSLSADLSWQAVIVGAPQNARFAQRLETLARAPDLAGRVRLAGRVGDEELARLYGQARIFALATRYEGYGIGFDEAMRHGLPIVSCSTGAVPDTVARGAGQLVPPEDPAAFAAALARVLGDDGLRSEMAAASKSAGATLPGWSETARQVAGVLDAVIDRMAAHG